MGRIKKWEVKLSELENEQNGNAVNPENSPNSDSDSFVGKFNDTAYFFNSEAEAVTAFDHSFLASMKTKAEQ
ncbi:MAG: hypothetical protein RIA69_01870 [Cyclobacteriaceae bacterium]